MSGETTHGGEFIGPQELGRLAAGLRSSLTGRLVCRAHLTREEYDRGGEMFDQHRVRGSGWTCERCGVELEHQPRDERPRSRGRGA